MQTSTFHEVAQDIAAIQQRRFAERAANLLSEIHAAQRVIERNTDTGHDRSVYVNGVLRATLAGMAGLGEYATHASCFDSDVTQAIQDLLEAINR